MRHIFIPFMAILGASMSIALFVGVHERPVHLEITLLLAAMAANLVAALSRSGRRNDIGSVGLAASLVAVVQLVLVAMIWGHGMAGPDGYMNTRLVAEAASLAGGAVLASMVPVVVLVVDLSVSPR